MSEQIPGGAFTVARKLFSSPVWLKDPLYLKLWIWVIGRASHSKHTKNGWERKRGEFVTTYDEIIKSIYHIHNRRRFYPTIKKIRIILRWLESENMIFVKPLKSERNLTGADTRADTRAYVGIKIIVINYTTYQDLKSYKGRHQDGHIFEQGHNNKNGNNNVKETPAFFSLKKRYNQKLIDQVFKAIASCRKSNKIADSVLLAQLEKWQRYPVEQVELAIKVYLEKDYAAQGKREAYLLGIIRNQKTESKQSKQQSTGSPQTLTPEEIERLTTRNE